MARGVPIFDPRGRGRHPCQSIDRACSAGCVRLACTPKPSALLPLRTAKKIGVFCHSFAAVAAAAQALQRTMEEQLHIATMRDDVVSYRRLNAQSMAGAFSAERLAGQLSASASCPTVSWVCVQVMPSS